MKRKLNKFQLLCVAKILRADKLYENVQSFVKDQLGSKFIEALSFDLVESFDDSSNCIPLIFILSRGEDPLKHFYKLAKEKCISHKIQSISLGQGQIPIAINAIQNGVLNGNW
jgi:dynein heavy chain